MILKYVKERTPEICLVAVNQNGWALRYVKEQTPEICLAAVKRYKLTSNLIKDESIKHWVISQL